MAHDWGGIIDYEKAHDRPSLIGERDGVGEKNWKVIRGIIALIQN